MMSTTLRIVQTFWKALLVANAAQMHECDKPADGEAKQQRRNSRNDGFEIFAERHGGERDRRGEPDGRRDPAGEKSERRMIGAREKIVFAARARKHRSEFAVAERAAQRGDPTDDPEQQKWKSRT